VLQSMCGLYLIADDLTGALDSACAFATRAKPVSVRLADKPCPPTAHLAISTETRDRQENEATRITTDLFLRHAGVFHECERPVIWFKKIDSVLRGHPFAETKAIFAAGGFDHCVFAPAYPQMGRITKGGQQYRLSLKGKQPVGSNFAEIWPKIGMMPILIDADNQDILQQRVLTLSDQLKGKILWVGTGGLAHALNQKSELMDFSPVIGMIVGTNHPVSVAQTQNAIKAGALMIKDTASAYQYAASTPWIFSPALQENEADRVRQSLLHHIPFLKIAQPQQSSLIVTGGETLSLVLQVIGANYLECVGEACPGVPVCLVQGGQWHGLTLLTKSGGFGAPDLFSSLTVQ